MLFSINYQVIGLSTHLFILCCVTYFIAFFFNKNKIPGTLSFGILIFHSRKHLKDLINSTSY